MERYSVKHLKSKKVRYSGETESRSQKGMNPLLRANARYTLASFIYKEEILYLVTDYETTFISRIRDGKFERVFQISDVSYWTYDPIIQNLGEEGLFIYSRNDEQAGFIHIKGGEIRISSLCIKTSPK